MTDQPQEPTKKSSIELSSPMLPTTTASSAPSSPDVTEGKGEKFISPEQAQKNIAQNVSNVRKIAAFFDNWVQKGDLFQSEIGPLPEPPQEDTTKSSNNEEKYPTSTSIEQDLDTGEALDADGYELINTAESGDQDTSPTSPNSDQQEKKEEFVVDEKEKPKSTEKDALNEKEQQKKQREALQREKEAKGMLRTQQQEAEKKQQKDLEHNSGLDGFKMEGIGNRQRNRTGLGIDGDISLLSSFLKFLSRVCDCCSDHKPSREPLHFAPQSKIKGINAIGIKTLLDSGNLDPVTVSDIVSAMSKPEGFADVVRAFFQSSYDLNIKLPQEEIKSNVGSNDGWIGWNTWMAGWINLLASATAFTFQTVTLNHLEKDWFYTACALIQMGLRELDPAEIKSTKAAYEAAKSGTDTKSSGLLVIINRLEQELATKQALYNNQEEHDKLPPSERIKLFMDLPPLRQDLQSAKNELALYISIQEAAYRTAQGELSETEHANAYTINKIYRGMNGNRAASFLVGFVMLSMDVGLFALLTQPTKSASIGFLNAVKAATATFEMLNFRSGGHLVKKSLETVLSGLAAAAEEVFGSTLAPGAKLKDLKEAKSRVEQAAMVLIYDSLTQIQGIQAAVLNHIKHGQPLKDSVRDAYLALIFTGGAGLTKHLISAIVEVSVGYGWNKNEKNKKGTSLLDKINQLVYAISDGEREIYRSRYLEAQQKHDAELEAEHRIELKHKKGDGVEVKLGIARDYVDVTYYAKALKLIADSESEAEINKRRSANVPLRDMTGPKEDKYPVKQAGVPKKPESKSLLGNVPLKEMTGPKENKYGPVPQGDVPGKPESKALEGVETVELVSTTTTAPPMHAQLDVQAPETGTKVVVSPPLNTQVTGALIKLAQRKDRQLSQEAIVPAPKPEPTVTPVTPTTSS